MQQLSNRLAANVLATVHVFSSRLRDDKGQSSAEYVGILAFVALLTVTIIGFHGAIGTSLNGVITAAIGKITTALG